VPPPPGPPPSEPGWASVPAATATFPQVGTDDGPAPASSPSPPPSPGRPRLSQIPGLPLTIILTIQAVLSARLIARNNAFSDEALYLWAGRLEWAHWLHGAPVPDFASYFSGAPVVYPPVAALADAIGGLTAARLASLGLMLGATILLHGLARRIFDRQSASFAAAVFVALGPVQFLGAFATYDALAIFLLALATWLGVRAAGCRVVAARSGLLVLAGVVLATADAAKYAAALFDVVVVLAIGCYHWHARGRRDGVFAGLLVTIAAAGAIAAALAAGGHPYWAGVTSTTLSRATSNWPAFGIWYASTGWVGVALILAVFGAIAASCATKSPAARTMIWTLAGAGFLAPAEQARIHVFTSLFKHVAFGGWFAAPLAGYALTAFIKAIPISKMARARRLALGLVALSGLLGALLAADHYGNWANTDPVLPTLSATIRIHPGQLLVDDGPSFDYYLAGVQPWQRITAVPNESSADLALAVRQRQFSVIMLSYALGGGGCGNADPKEQSSQSQCLHNVDLKVLGDIIGDGGYQLVARIPYSTTAFHGAYLVYARGGDRR
jgi:4-amino-4-deoxy-L-arabinose transferase-like glycosyltransferase